MAKEINLDAFADKIADRLLAAKQQAREAGEDVGEEFVKGVVKGVQQHSKEAKSEITKLFEDFNKTTNNFKSRKSVTQAEWTRVLGLSKELMKSERYADRVKEKLSDISVTLKNGTKVSGLEKVLEEWTKVGGLVESVQWAEAGKNYRKKPSTKKPKVETPVAKADPTPVVKAEEKRQEVIEDTTKSVENATKATEQYIKAQEKLAEVQSKLKSGSEQTAFQRGRLYSGREGRLTLARRIGSDLSEFGLSSDEIDKLVDSTYEQFSKVKNLLVDKQEWDNMIKGTIRENSFGKQLNQLFSVDIFNQLGPLQEFGEIVDQVHDGLISVSDAMQRTSDLVDRAIKPHQETTQVLHEQASAAESAAKAQEKLNKAQKQSALSDKEVEHALDVKAKYTGAKLQGKSDFISAIKDEWGRGNKAVSAKLFEQYKARFPGGTYDPSTDKSFGADWADNYNKYLEQANRHIAELDKRLGGVVGGVVEIQGEFKKLSEIIAESKNAALSGIDLNNSKFIQTDKYDYTDSDITDMKTHIESVRKEADQLKDEALAAKQAFDEVSNIRSEYFGVSLRRKTGWNNKTKSEYDAGKKSDWQSAIKSAWDQGNKPLAAKLYEQYQINFPKGTFDPSKQARFGEDWVNNYAKYLEQANRHIVELDTMLRNMGAEYGKYIAYFELDSFANENAARLERIKQEGKLVGEVVRSDLDTRKEVAHNKYATGDQVIAQENLNKAVAEYNRRQAVANDLLEFRNEMIEALDDDSKEYLFEGYKTPADAIQDASGKYSDARLDADRFAITELEEAIRVARELGIEIDEAYTVPDDKKNKIVNDILMRQRRFVMNNAKAGTPEKSQQIWDAAITKQNEYQQELAETEQAVERVSAAESNIIYHAGDLSNPSKTQKTYPLGNVRPSKDGVVFSGFTGLYTTEDVGEFWGNEWSGAPISTIDASQYKLFDASSDAVASAVKVFFDNLNGTIYGYVDDFTTGAAKRLTDVKTVDELWADFNEIFKSANIGFETFEAFIKRAQGLVYGKNFMEIYDLPDIDEGIVKTGEDNVLQGASKEVFNSDSFQTQLLKMLGFEGIDLRGTKFNGTYTGGTVIFDVKPESIQTTNEKWSDVMARNGYRVDEVALAHEEKRRQLAFDTAKAYSQQADTAKEVVQLTDNYNSELDESNNKLMQGTKLVNEQGQIIRLFHNSDSVFDKFTSDNMSESNMLGKGHYLSFDQEQYQSYGKYQTQWYANVQKMFDANTSSGMSIDDATKIIETYCTDAVESFCQRMLSDLTGQNGSNALSAAMQIAEAYNVDISDIFKTAGYDSIRINDEINVFDPSKIYRANDSVVESNNGAQNIEEINHINAERAKQLKEFVETSKSMFSEELTLEESAIMTEILNKISLEGMSAADAVKELSNALKTLRGQQDVLETTSDDLKETFDVMQQGESVTGKFVTTAKTVKEALENMRRSLPEEQKEWGVYIDDLLKQYDDKSFMDNNKAIYGSMGDRSEQYKIENLGDGRLEVTFSGIRDEAHATSIAIQKLEDHVNNLGVEFKQSEHYRDNFSILIDGIKSGSITAAQAMEKMSDVYENWSASLVDTDVDNALNINVNKNDPVIASAFNGMGIKDWISKMVKPDSRVQLEDELYKLAQTIVDGDNETYSAQLSHIADFIVDNYRAREKKEANTYEDVFKELVVVFDDEDVAAMGPQLFEKAKSILGKRLQKRTEKNKYFDGIDQLVSALATNHSGLFSDPDGNESQYNKLDELLDHYSAWKQDSKRKTVDVTLSDADKQGIMDDFNANMMPKMWNNMMESASKLEDEQLAFDGVASSADKAAKAKERFDKANKKVKEGADQSSDSLDDEADSLEDVNRAAANMPDVSAYDSTSVRVGADGRPYSISGTATMEAIDGSHVRTTDTYSFNEDSNRWDYDGSVQSTERTREMVQALEEYYKILNKVQKLRLDASGKIHTEEINKLEAEDLARAYQRVCNLGIQVNDIEGQINLSVNQRQALLDVELRARREMYDVIAKMEDKQATTSAKPYQKTVRDELKKSADIDTNVRLLDDDGVGDRLQNQIADYRRLVDELVDMRLQLARNSDLANDVDFSNRFADTAKRAQDARVAIEGIFKQSQKLDQVMANMDVFGSKDLDPSELKNLQQAMLSFASSVEDGVFKFKGFNKAGTEMYGTLEQSSGAIKNVTVALKQSSDQLFMYGTNANRADNEWEEFKNTLASGTKNLVRMYVGFQEGVQAIRSGAEAVKQIDLAMTELKKVTDETDDSYREFLEDSGRTSAVIGSTVSDFAEASATFARLGYSLDEASSMAETAIVYKNVADGLDTVEESSESIISTMMAFGIEASDTMGIIDRFNAVGNNFAITSAGIGDALQRSASALYSAGNTIDESVALVTAANSVIQNPEQVGTALKTLALRLRGAKVELEDAGLETDAMAESTSQLQAKLKALTHGEVDIMLNED